MGSILGSPQLGKLSMSDHRLQPWPLATRLEGFAVAPQLSAANGLKDPDAEDSGRDPPYSFKQQVAAHSQFQV